MVMEDLLLDNGRQEIMQRRDGYVPLGTYLTGARSGGAIFTYIFV